MSGRWIARLLLFCAAALQVVPCCAADADVSTAEIVRRAANAMRADWDAVPDYAFIQNDEVTKGGKVTSTTNQVVMMAGSDYYMPIAINGRDLTPDRRKVELQKLKTEYQHRNNEGPSARKKRMATYVKQREQNGALLLNFPDAFTFESVGNEARQGHQACVLAATPRKEPINGSVTAKILAGMKGQVWVDQDTFHWIRAEAAVVKSVSIFGIFARVLQGTRMELEMVPVTDTIWLVSLFSVDATVSRFFFRSTQKTRTTYSDYKLNGPVLDALLAEAGD